MASAPSAPSVNNTNAGLKIPTFNTSSFRIPPMTNEAGNRSARLQSSTTMLSNGLVSTNTSTTKITVGGKVIDVDVLTKLHQAKNNGNVITFNASKDLLSNLAVKKLVGTKTVSQIKQNGVANKVELLTKQQQQQQQQPVGKTISVTVFSTQGKKNQEKFLLPKTNQPLIEIKKFAPEMNGLLTALKTSSSTIKKPIVAQNVNDKHVMKGYTLQNKPLRAPFVVNSKDQHKKPLMLFQPSTTSVQSQYAPKTNILQQNTYNRQATVTTTPRPNIQQQRLRNSNNINNNNIKTTSFNNRMNVITSLTTKPSTSSKPISAIVENRAYKANKVMLENNKKANYKIKNLLLKDLTVKNSNKDFTRIEG